MGGTVSPARDAAALREHDSAQRDYDFLAQPREKLRHLKYAGEVSPREAFDALMSLGPAQLVDVRTPPEWQFVGVPDLSALGKQPLCIPWKLYPSFQTNPNFVAELQAEVPEAETPLFFLCRSGGRSLDAAVAMTEAGYRACYNITGGFEGDQDGEGHRSTLSGWKVDRLSWVQG